MNSEKQIPGDSISLTISIYGIFRQKYTKKGKMWSTILRPFRRSEKDGAQKNIAGKSCQIRENAFIGRMEKDERVSSDG